MKDTTFQSKAMPELLQKLFPSGEAKALPELEAADPATIASLAHLDPRTVTFEREAAHEIARGRKRAEQAFRAAEEELTATDELLKSPDFRAAAAENAELRKTIATVAREAGARRKELLAQKRALGLVSTAPRAKARARVQPKPPK